MLNISKARLTDYLSLAMEKGWLSSFTEYGKVTEHSGGPTMLFVCESLENNGTCLITGASKSKLGGYDQLQTAVNQNRAGRFLPEERDEIRQKAACYRNATEEMKKDRIFIEQMKPQFDELQKWEAEKTRINGMKGGGKGAPRAQGGGAYKALKQKRKDRRSELKAKIIEAELMVKKAALVITGEARKRARESALPQDYFDHTKERGLAMMSDRLQKVNPCWMCHGIYRFAQLQESSEINWTGHDHEEGIDIGTCAEAIAHAQSYRKRSESGCRR